MKKLIGFGDSFIAPSSKDNWLEKLGMLLDLPVVNYGASGSALNYSLIKFLEYIQSAEYDNTDVIVFITTEHSRIYCKGIKSYMNSFLGSPTVNRFQQEDKDWINQNLEHVLWITENYLTPELNFETINLICLLQEWANTNPTNVVVVKTAYDLDLSLSGKLKNIIIPTSNFLPIIDHPVNQIQQNEFVNMDCYIKTVTKRDPRINHLSERNREVISKLIFDVISNCSIEYYDKSKFHSHFINSDISSKQYDWVNG